MSATATDNVAVNDVRFQLDGVNLGADLTASPYTIQWDTTTATNGTHTLTAIAKDTSGNSATSAAITVTVNNTVTGPPTQGLIGYWNFDEGSRDHRARHVGQRLQRHRERRDLGGWEDQQWH